MTQHDRRGQCAGVARGECRRRVGREHPRRHGHRRSTPTRTRSWTRSRWGTAPRGSRSCKGSVWVANEWDGTLSRIEPGQTSASPTVIGSVPQGLAGVNGELWVSVRGTATSHRGGTLRVVALDPPDSLDPGDSYDSVAWEVLHLLGDGLVAIRADRWGPQARPRPGHRHTDTDRRRPDVHVPVAARDPILERRGRRARRLPPCARTRVASQPERVTSTSTAGSTGAEACGTSLPRAISPRAS